MRSVVHTKPSAFRVAICVWVLRRVYGFTVANVVSAVEALIASAHVSVNRPAVDAELAILKLGGDFADA